MTRRETTISYNGPKMLGRSAAIPDHRTDRRQADDVRRLILIGSLLAETVRQQLPAEAHLSDGWEQQLDIARSQLVKL